MSASQKLQGFAVSTKSCLFLSAPAFPIGRNVGPESSTQLSPQRGSQSVGPTGKVPLRKRLSALQLLKRPSSEDDEDVSSPELERKTTLLLSHTKTLSKLKKGGISKNQSERLMELLQEIVSADKQCEHHSSTPCHAGSNRTRAAMLRARTKVPYYSGYILLCGKLWKKMWADLTEESLCIYSCQEKKKLRREVLIEEIVCINHQDKNSSKNGQQHCFQIRLASQSQVCLCAYSLAENAKWILALDGMKTRSILTTCEKFSLLRSMNFTDVKGGSAKFKDEEEWTYNGMTGEIVVSGGLEWEGTKIDVRYTWNGQTLVATKVDVEGSSEEIEELTEVLRSGFGSGMWDGMTLKWYLEGGTNMLLQDFSLLTPHYDYLWNPQEREFINEQCPEMGWKFSRHFLASKSDHGHWIVEGAIPEPVVMGLQMMRYSRMVGAP